MKIRYYKHGPKTKVVAVLNDWTRWVETRKRYEKAKERYNLKKDDFIFIDYNIFKHILLLNNKGYKTLYSCEGHRRKYSKRNTVISDIYLAILIEDNFDKYAKYLANVPDGFDVYIKKLYNIEEDKLAKAVVIYQQPVNYDRMCKDKEYFNKVKKEDLESLYKFIRQLPDISKDTD
jgi:hypothetical protein